jgi:hypothetical protein
MTNQYVSWRRRRPKAKTEWIAPTELGRPRKLMLEHRQGGKAFKPSFTCRRLRTRTKETKVTFTVFVELRISSCSVGSPHKEGSGEERIHDSIILQLHVALCGFGDRKT